MLMPFHQPLMVVEHFITYYRYLSIPDDVLIHMLNFSLICLIMAISFHDTNAKIKLIEYDSANTKFQNINRPINITFSCKRPKNLTSCAMNQLRVDLGDNLFWDILDPLADPPYHLDLVSVVGILSRQV